jgi:hypothetical protein
MPVAAPRLTHRAAVALAASVWAGATVWLRYRHLPLTATSDFDAAWAAARALLGGLDPYAAIQSPPWPWTLQYPLPAVLLACPFTVLPLDVARAVFMAASTGLLAFGLSRRAWWPLIALLGGPMLIAVSSVQWTPLLAAAALYPWLGAVWAAKPSTGAALFAAYPSRRALIGGLVFVGVAFVVWPHWLEGWRQALAGAEQRPAVLRLGGILLLLGLLRWRLPEGRQLAVLALVPLSPHLYEAVPLALVARSRREVLALTVCGTLGAVAGYFWPPAHVPDHGPRQWAIMFLAGYLPALAVTLRHRALGAAPGPAPFVPIDAEAMAAVV